jgi:ferredoxin
MTAIINFKICDNSEECDGLNVCPVKAITWNSKKNTLEINESKCTNCGACARSCAVGAIRVATGQELEFIKQEYKNDKRKTSDLFIDRYGAQSTDKTSLISQTYFQSLISKNQPMVFEIFDSASTMCLINSIPVRELFKKNILYNRVDTHTDKTLINQFKIKELPCLLFFENGKLKGKVEGYFDTTQKEKLISIVSSLI